MLTPKQKNEKALVIFHKSLEYCDNFYNTLNENPKDSSNFRNFGLEWNGENNQLVLTAKFNHSCGDVYMEEWANIDFTIFKKLISISNRYRKQNDEVHLNVGLLL